MRKYWRPYSFSRPPRAIRNAKRENIAIVPASMLPFKEIVTELLNGLPPGGVILCHSEVNTRQRKLLERVGQRFQEQGHAVVSLPMEQITNVATGSKWRLVTATLVLGLVAGSGSEAVAPRIRARATLKWLTHQVCRRAARYTGKPIERTASKLAPGPSQGIAGAGPPASSPPSRSPNLPAGEAGARSSSPSLPSTADVPAGLASFMVMRIIP